MQIIVDIPKEYYGELQKEDLILDPTIRIFKNGIPLPENPTNGDMVQAIFDDRGYKAIKERMEHTMWWKAPYEKERKE